MSTNDPPRPDAGSDPSLVLGEIANASKGGDAERAFALADAALKGGMRHPILFNARAAWLGRQGRFEEMLGDLEALKAFAPPGDPGLHGRIGNCLLRLRRPAEALEALDAAAMAAPNLAPVHYDRAIALGMLRQDEDMRLAYERVVALQPGHADALAALALVAARAGHTATAVDYAARALATDPAHTTARTIHALSDIARGDGQTAEATIRAVLGDPRAARDSRLELALDRVAHAFDSAGFTSQAFFVRKVLNARRRAIMEGQFGPGRMVDQIRTRIAYFNACPAWSAAPAPPAAGEAAGHVFLLGFMRSGTTLLETVLAASPDVVAFDEREFLADAARSYLFTGAGLDRLSALTDAERGRLRDNYWAGVKGAGAEVEGKVFVDKMPFNSLRLPLIAKLFPEAKVLFALRDPRDVVFSCFRHSFEAHHVTFEFLDLTDCARFYATAMELVDLYRQKLPLHLLEHRYEELVRDFEASMRRVCDFIGIGWNDSMREFQKASRVVRDHSMSAAQVSRGLYAGGSDHWRKYRTELAPIFPVLRPWVERFGYPPD